MFVRFSTGRGQTLKLNCTCTQRTRSHDTRVRFSERPPYIISIHKFIVIARQIIHAQCIISTVFLFSQLILTDRLYRYIVKIMPVYDDNIGDHITPPRGFKSGLETGITYTGYDPYKSKSKLKLKP